MKKDRSVFFKWPGVAGIELRVEDSILIVDPYFTRAPFYKMWAGRIVPDRELTRKYIKNCDFVLVTHSHIDHLMDVPDVVRHNHCSVYGSGNTCGILSCERIPDKYINKIKAGDSLDLGQYKVDVLHAEHRNVLGFFYPLTVPLRPYFKSPAKKFPFFKKVDLDEFTKDIKKIDKKLKILIPEIFKDYDIISILN